MSFNIDGIDKLVNALEVLSNPETVDAALIKGLTKAGRQVQITAKALCTVNTGLLRNSIEVTPISNGVDIGTDEEQAIYVEYGTGPLGDPTKEHTMADKWFAPSDEVDPRDGIDKQTAEKYHFAPVQTKYGLYYIVHSQSPQPFLHPAVNANKEIIKTIVSQTLQEAIKKAVK